MELKVYKDMVSASEVICDTKAEVPIETELLIPDYLPEVFKVVKCFIKPIVLQKHISQNRFTVEGYMRCLVYYQTKDIEGMCQIEQKIPFTRQIELRDGEYLSYDAFITGETEYLNCRAVSGRRLDIRGAYALAVYITSQEKQEIFTAVSENGTEQKLLLLSGTKKIALADKIITAQESISFDTAPEMILDTACCSIISEVKLMQGKAIVKGVVDAQVSYRAASDNTILKAVKQIPFNEILDMEGVAEDCKAFVYAEPTGCTILAGVDGGECSISVTALITARAYKACEYYAVVDAFSTIYDTVVSNKDIMIDELADNFSTELVTIAAGLLPQENMQIIDVRAEALPIEQVEENGETILRGRAIAHLICKNELGELECFDKTAEYTLPKHYPIAQEVLKATCFPQVKTVTARKVGAQTEANINISVSGIISKQSKVTVIDSIECENERQSVSSDIALHVYYVQEGEKLFDIAKRYGASPAAIASANSIEQEAPLIKQQLLIPS